MEHLMKRYCGRDFSPNEQVQIRQLIEDNPDTHRAGLSRQVCRLLAWYKADGGLKEMSCRVAMLRMHEDGLICLPPPRRTKPPARKFSPTTASEPQAPLPGAQLRYFVMLDEQVVALLGFGAAAWQVAPRDKYIGWTHEQRRRHLPLIVNNARFLILPWIQSKNLASKILAMASRQLPGDWFNRYNIRPVLMETFVETERFAGTCYRAANWRTVGRTQGRGKLGPTGKLSVPVKDILLYPLARDFRKVLTN
jgi:hypothetical protein